MHTYVLKLNLIVEILNTSQKQLRKVRYAFIILLKEKDVKFKLFKMYYSPGFHFKPHSLARPENFRKICLTYVIAVFKLVAILIKQIFLHRIILHTPTFCKVYPSNHCLE